MICRSAILILAASCAVGSAQPAEHGPTPELSVDALLKALDHEEPRQRELAQARLQMLERFTLRDIESRLAQDDLSAEQRLRLESLAWQRFEAGPRAAMGVGFGSIADGVTIGSVVNGFPARELLVEGDVIMQADGRPMRSERDLRSAILLHDPGDIMKLEIVRAGTPMTIDLPLGSYADLQSGARITHEVLVEAWRVRRGALAAAGERPTFDARPEEIGPVETLLASSGIRWRIPSDRTVGGGGTPRGGVDLTGRLRLHIGGHDVSIPRLAFVIDRQATGAIRFRLDRMLDELRAEQDRIRSLEIALDREFRERRLAGEIDDESVTRMSRAISHIRRLRTTLESEFDQMWQALNAVNAFGR